MPVSAGHSFEEALTNLKGGLSVARYGWNGADQFLTLQRPDAHSKMTLPYVFITTATNEKVPWLASQTDLLSEDWFTKEELL